MTTYRTDLAMEAFDGIQEDVIPGVSVSHWQTQGVRMTLVEITDNEAANALGKARGSYLTLECPGFRQRSPEMRHALSALLAEELARLLPSSPQGAPLLVVGLGNRAITPDSLGPSVVDRTLVTRHMLSGPFAVSGLNSVCAIAPGVLGLTGIETMEIVDSVVKRVEPYAILCIDSLAARDARRIGSTLQLSDTGIQPGGGVGNHRRALTQESVGVPVIAIGMPTVIYAAALARDAFSWLSDQSGDEPPSDESLQSMEKALLNAEIGEMIVTPREIDTLIDDAAQVIATGINRAVQSDLSEAEILEMMG